MHQSSRSTRVVSGVPARRMWPVWPRWLIVGLVGWGGVLALGAQLYGANPRRAGFDLELLLTAGRRVAEGAQPYDAAMLAGRAPTAVDLFYSYPPPVAQYLSLFASVPSAIMLVAWGVVAVAGLLTVSVGLARRDEAVGSVRLTTTLVAVGLPVLALAPLVFPFAIALIFGNLDALFPLLYGLMLVGALGKTLPARFGGGVALAIAGVAKVHPAAMGVWFLVRGLRDRRRGRSAPADRGANVPPMASRRSSPSASRPPASRPSALPGSWVVLGAAVAVGLVILALSLVAGGSAPWFDYLAVLRSGAAAAVIDPRNIAPAAQIALLLGGDESLARILQVGVTVAAIAGTAAAAWLRDDTLESFTWATVASLVVLPITWFHYPVALIPIALVAWLRSDTADRRLVDGLLAGAAVVGIFALAVPVFVWCSVGLVLVAVLRSVPASVSTLPFPQLEPSRIARFPAPGEFGATAGRLARSRAERPSTPMRTL